MEDRIEAKGMDKIIKSIKWLAVCSVALVIIRVIFSQETFLETNQFDLLIFLSPFLAYIATKKKLNKKKGQFIEWSKNEINFKTKSQEKSTIKIDNIIELEQKVHQVLIRTDKSNYKIDFEDFKNYDDRQKLKHFFNDLNKKLSTTRGYN